MKIEEAIAYQTLLSHPAILPAVSQDRDLAAELAAEIRAAVAQTSPERRPPSAPHASRAGDAVHAALQRAQAHSMPAIPEAARFSWAKRIGLRLLRFVWRDQASFNSFSLEASSALASGLAGQVESTDRLRQDVATLVSEIEHRGPALETRVADWITMEERRRAICDARLALLEAAALRSETGQAPSAQTGSAGIPPGVYSLFEERFRGSPEEIAARQRRYATLLEGIPGPVLDVGCGRGEFLRILLEKEIAASGVDINPIALAECRKLGLDVEEADGIAALVRRPAESLGAVVAFQVVEHWSPETTFAFLRETRRVLAPGGVLIAETINVGSLSAWRAFFLDPSHVRAVPAETLQLLAEAVGFQDTSIEYQTPLAPEERLTEVSENEVKLNRLLFGPQDYALIARVPSVPDGTRDTGHGTRKE